MAEPNGTQNIRSVCDRAISFAGFHVTKGYSLWDAYRQFELAVLGGYQVKIFYNNYYFFN
jgi:hypothetical protein